MLSVANRPIVGLLIFALPMVAEATRVTVDVRLPDGARAGAGVTVTVTENGVLTPSPPRVITDRQSRARFANIAEGQAIIVATRDGARGEWSGRIRGKNQNIQVTMEYGLISTAPATAPAAQDTNGDPAPSVEEEPVGVTNTTSVEPTPDPPRVVMQIERDAECTALGSGEVTLYAAVSGPAPGEYRASENSSFAGSSWQPYVANPRFRLSAGPGQKRVYYQVRSTVDGTLLESNVSSDVIERVVSNARATLAINGGAGTTYSNTVMLNNTASFDGGGSNPRYIASESPQFTGAQWQSYNTAPSFALSAGAGTKTVYFMATREVCGITVGTEIVSDTIDLVETIISAVSVGTAEPAPPPELRIFEFGSWNTAASLATIPPAGTAAKYAAQQGFTHRGSVIGGSGQCKVAYDDVPNNSVRNPPTLYSLAEPAIDSSTGTLVKSLICEFSLFGGRRLNPGWRVTAVRVTAQQLSTEGKWTGTVNIVNAPSGDNLQTLVRINVPAYHCGSLLDGLELCPQDSFRPDIYGHKFVVGGFLDFLRIEGPSDDWRDAFNR